MNRKRFLLWLTVATLYALGLVATQKAVDAERKSDRQQAAPLIEASRAVALPPMDDKGPVDARPLIQQYRGWGSATGRPPVILLHGSPGGFDNFVGSRSRPGLGERCADGRRSSALDLPGMGRTKP